MPMVRVPDRTFRTRVPGDECRPARWYDHWEYLPGQEATPHKWRRKVYLGRSERLNPERYTRTKEHRFYPASGEWPQKFERWIEGIIWLQQLYRQHNPNSGLKPLI